MTTTKGAWLLAAATLLLAAPAMAQQLMVYPEKGQSQDQQNRDQYECHRWSVQQTGFDPTQQQASQAAPPPQAQGGGAMGGATRGAAIGAVGGAIGGNAGKGAAIGAATGGVVGGIRRRQAEQQQTAQAQQSGSSMAQEQAGYNRAMKTCLQARGYAVN